MRTRVKDAVYNEMTPEKLLELNLFVTVAERSKRKTIQLKVGELREILNYIFELEQDLRWNTSKYGVVVPPFAQDESDGRLENLEVPGQ